MADGEIRVVLVKPGDVLLIGNVGPATMASSAAVEQAQRVVENLNALGVKTVVFAADIEIDKVPRDAL